MIRPVGSTAQPGDLGAVVLGQPLDAVEDGVVLGRADDDPAAAGVGLPAGPEQALDREVVALGAAAGEQDLRRPRTQRLGQPLARLLGDPAGGAAARVQRGGVAHAAQLLGHRSQHLGEHRRGRRVVQVRHGAASVVAGSRTVAAVAGRHRPARAGPPGHRASGERGQHGDGRAAPRVAQRRASPPVAAATSTPTTPMHSAEAVTSAIWKAAESAPRRCSGDWSSSSTPTLGMPSPMPSPATAHVR